METRMAGKAALVTGGASGIGRATCRRLAKEGARVAVADVDAAGAKVVAGELGGVLAVPLDVTDEAQWIDVIGGVARALGRFDVLVNCAGVGVSGNFEELALAEWNRMIDVNLTGVFLGCKHAIPAMRAAGNGGAIVNISSIAGLVGGEDIAGYAASKGGVTLLTRSVALHCARHAPGVRCNSVHPTYVDTAMLDPVAASFPDRATMLAGMAELVPIGRVAEAEDIAGVIAFLISDDSRMMTGGQLLVDGGQLAGLPARHTAG